MLKINFGNGNDLSIFHTGSHSNIEADGTGDLKITQKTADQDIIFRCDDGSGGETAYLTLDGSLGFTTIQKHVRWEDGIIARFGNSDDGSLYHSGGHFYMGNNTGDIIVTNTTDDGDIIFQSDDGSGGVQTYLTIDGGLEAVTVPDTIYLAAGGGLDLSLRHDGSNSHIQNNTGDLTIKNASNDSDIIFQSDDGSGGLATYLTLDGGLGILRFKRTCVLMTTLKQILVTVAIFTFTMTPLNLIYIIILVI